jgi:hypothetical protein
MTTPPDFTLCVIIVVVIVVLGIFALIEAMKP